MPPKAAATAAAAGARPAKAGGSTSSSSSSSARLARFVSPAALARNNELLAWARTVVALAGGALAGVWGLTGLKGFGLYGAVHGLVGAALLLTRLGLRPGDFFPNTGPLGLVAGGLMDNFMLYIVVWSFLYALLHVY